MNLSKDFRNNIIIIIGALLLEIPVYFLYFSSHGSDLWGVAFGGSIVLSYIILAPIISFVIAFKMTKTNKLLSALSTGLGTFILLIGFFFWLVGKFEY